MMDTIARFWNYVDKTGECWIWTRCRNRFGYGLYNFFGPLRQVHRIAYELTKGAIPTGMFVCHTCDNRACCNPDHLFLGTAADNSRDMVVKGRQATGSRHRSQTHPETLYRGEAHYKSGLSDAQVREIRRLAASGVRPPELARQFGISREYVYKIVKYQTRRITQS